MFKKKRKSNKKKSLRQETIYLISNLLIGFSISLICLSFWGMTTKTSAAQNFILVFGIILLVIGIIINSLNYYGYSHHEIRYLYINKINIILITFLLIILITLSIYVQYNINDNIKFISSWIILMWVWGSIMILISTIFIAQPAKAEKEIKDEFNNDEIKKTQPSIENKEIQKIESSIENKEIDNNSFAWERDSYQENNINNDNNKNYDMLNNQKNELNEKFNTENSYKKEYFDEDDNKY